MIADSCHPDDCGDMILRNVVLTRATRPNIPEGGILHSHRRENFKSYTTLTVWNLWRRGKVFPAKHDLGFYIPESSILLSHSRQNYKRCMALTGWAL
jgi:hypothetical protein